MKKSIITTIILLFASATVYGQTQTLTSAEVQNGNVVKNQKFQSYIAIDGCTYNVGDIIYIGTPSLGKKFAYYATVNQISGIHEACKSKQRGKAKTIKTIKVIGNSKKGYSCAFALKGFTGSPTVAYMIVDVDAAIQSEEMLSKKVAEKVY